MTYTTIVAGVGDVEANTHVIDRACEMARLCDAALLLVAGFDPVSARDKARINESVDGTAVDAVTLVTLETEADLVIVGSKGVDSLFGRVFGAVSVQVLRKSKCDVLVVVP